MKNIEDILDQCLEELQDGKTPDEVLAAHPDHVGELRSLLETATALKKLPDPQPSVNGLIELMAKQAVEEHDLAAGKYRFLSRPVLLRVAAAILILFLAGYGTVAVSANALPGQMMYPVKLFTEKVRFFLALTSENKVELRIVYSEERLQELVEKFNNGGGVDKNVLNAMLDEAKMALESTHQLSADNKDLMLPRISKLSHLQSETLLSLKAKASPEEKEILAKCAKICADRCQCCSLKGKTCGARDCPECGGK